MEVMQKAWMLQEDSPNIMSFLHLTEMTRTVTIQNDNIIIHARAMGTKASSPFAKRDRAFAEWLVPL